MPLPITRRSAQHEHTCPTFCLHRCWSLLRQSKGKNTRSTHDPDPWCQLRHPGASRLHFSSGPRAILLVKPPLRRSCTRFGGWFAPQSPIQDDHEVLLHPNMWHAAFRRSKIVCGGECFVSSKCCANFNSCTRQVTLSELIRGRLH